MKSIWVVALVVLVQSAAAGFGRGWIGGKNDAKSLGDVPLSSSSASRRQGEDSRSGDIGDSTQLGTTAVLTSSSNERKQQSLQDQSRQPAGENFVKVSSSEGASDSADDTGAFAPLQVLCEVNGFLVPAIIDTGAQITIMSASCAKRCRISNSINTKFSGRAVGVGSSDIIGRIDGLGMRVGPVSFEGKVSVLREARVDFLIGLDLLKRFKSEVNLRDHVLKLQVRDRQYRVPLLNKNQELQVPVMAGGGDTSSSSSPSVSSNDDPDYFSDMDYTEEELAQSPPGAGPISKAEYRSLDSYRNGGSSRTSSRNKDAGLSLEGV